MGQSLDQMRAGVGLDCLRIRLRGVEVLEHSLKPSKSSCAAGLFALCHIEPATMSPQENVSQPPLF